MPDPLDEYRQATEAAMRRVLATDDPALQPLYGMMRYHLGWCDASFAPLTAREGKRLRPILCLLCCAGLGGDWRLATPYAAALELVHNFSLIHDDIEDGDRQRHQRPTVWAVWGLAQGVNTGDVMWCLARSALHDLCSVGYPAETVLAAVTLLDRACLALCEGQYLDIAFESRPRVTLGEYEHMARGKTAALFTAAFQGGGLLAGASANTQQRLAELGLALGLAFQIVDDLLGIWGDPAVTGKPVASDLASRKKTYPVACAFAWEAERGLRDLEQLYCAASEPADVAAIVRCLDRAGAREHAQQAARRNHEAALSLLATLPLQEPAASLLPRLIDSLLGRDY